MVAFPEKTGKKREDPYSGENPRRKPKGSGGADQEPGEGALGDPDEGRAGDLPEKPP